LEHLDNGLNSQFVKETNDLADQLQTLKEQCDSFDLDKPAPGSVIRQVNIKAATIFPVLDKYFDCIWGTVAQLKTDDYEKHQRYAQEKLIRFFVLSPLNKRIFEKPFGYDGDFITISYYYDNKDEGDSMFGKLTHHYTLNLPLAQAVRERIGYFNRYAVKTINKFGDNLSFASIGSGPGREIIDFISNNRTLAQITFNCLDFDERALNKIAADATPLQNGHLNFRIKLHYSSILKFIHDPQANLASQHLIYSFGLFDYLKNLTASKLIDNLTALLAPGGKLVVSNFADTITHKGFLFFLGGWALILRNEDEMHRLAAGINTKNVDLRIDPETKTNYYLTVTK